MAPDRQERRRIVVDGSNIATEGRTLPSLAQLDEAIRAFLEEYQGFATTDVTVVVDASFGHRIDPSEVPAFEQAIDHGEMVTPPAGAVGRGDGFILRIAEKSGALVLSNDSFQEFHAERPWLFEPGRLIGGKPVPAVGWVFTPRTPVRGVKSRSATTRSRRDGSAAGADTNGDTGVGAKKAAAGSKAAKSAKTLKAEKPAKAAKTLKAEKPAKSAKTLKAEKPAKSAKSTKSAKEVKAPKAADAAKAARATKSGGPHDDAGMAGATKSTKSKKAASMTQGETEAPGDQGPREPAKGRRPAKSARGGKGTRDGKGAQAVEATGTGTSPALNDPVTFLTFVADHPVGSTFDGIVVSFTSHGAHVEVDGMLCHVPLRGLGDPPPSRARQVLAKGERRAFVLVSLDAAGRRAALALPGFEGH